jgi:threonine/homoserine/homoserine lactone efflux protein
MLRAIVGVLLILWRLGFVLHIGGNVIHVLAVLGVAVLVYDAISARKKTS